MKVDATTIEELFAKAGKYEESMRQLDALIVANAPSMERWLFTSPSMTLLGYGRRTYDHLPQDQIWPILSIAPQKTQISFYISVDTDGEPLLSRYDTQLGKVSCGKGCVRFTKFENLNVKGVTAMVKEAAKASKAKK